MKTKEFRIYGEYEKFVKEREREDMSDPHDEPITTSRSLGISMSIKCIHYETAIKRFFMEHGDFIQGHGVLDGCFDEIINSCSKGCFNGEVIKENGRYTWKIINDISGYWYISLSGIIIYTGRHQIEKEITKVRQLLDIMDDGDICKFSNWKFKRIHNRIVFVK